MYCEEQSQRFDFPSPSELVNNAMHLYGPPVQVDDLSSDRTQLRLYPCMNFTCSGRIVKLMFIAPVETDNKVTVRWPEFGLWRELCNRSYGEDCYWMEVQRLSASQQPCLVHMNGPQTVGVYEIEFISNNTFEHGNFLGIFRPMATSNRDSSAMNVLYQNGGGYCDALAYRRIQWYNWWLGRSMSTIYISQQPIIPYIAIETGQMCMKNWQIICRCYNNNNVLIITFIRVLSLFIIVYTR